MHPRIYLLELIIYFNKPFTLVLIMMADQVPVIVCNETPTWNVIG